MLDRFSIHGVTSDALRTHVIDRLTFALDQHESHVAAISVHFGDMNGHKTGGNDKRFNVVVNLRGGGEVVIEERGDDAYSTVSLGADRVKQAVGRKLDR